METPEHRKAEAARADAEDAAGRAAELIADQVRTIVEAAEATATEVRHEAEEKAERVRRTAEEESQRVRQEAEAASARVRRQAAQTAALVSERIDKVERELTELLRESFAALRREAAGMATEAPTTSRPLAGPSARGSGAGVEADVLDREAARVEAAEEEAAKSAQLEAEEEEASALEPDEDKGAEDGSAEEREADEGRPERRGFFRRRAKDTYQPRTESDGESAPGAQDAEGARLIALNMALNGTPRGETARYLDSHFELDNADGILDDVYGRVAGA